MTGVHRAQRRAASSSATGRSSLAHYSVRMAHELSIETVYQDKSLGEKQPLWRNFFVGRQITNRFGFINIKREKEDRAGDPARHHRLPRRRHHRRFDGRQSVGRRAPGHRHRPGHALQRRPHHARRADGGAGGRGGAQGGGLRAPHQSSPAAPASTSNTIWRTCMRSPTGWSCSTAARSSPTCRRRT